MPRYAAKKDNNHNEIAQAFERCGCTVLDTSAYPGFVDILVWRHEARLVEIKNGTGKKTKAQKELKEKWPGPIHVVRSVDDAITLIRAWDADAAKTLPW